MNSKICSFRSFSREQFASSPKLLIEIAKRMKECFPGASCGNCGSGEYIHYLEQTLIVCFIKQTVVGMVLVAKGNGGYEIYSLCVGKDYRNKSICNNLVLKALDTIQKDEGKKVTIWLALDPYGEMFDVLVKFYSKIGFGDPKLLSKSPFANTEMGECMGMTLSPDYDFDSEQTIQRARMLKESVT